MTTEPRPFSRLLGEVKQTETERQHLSCHQLIEQLVTPLWVGSRRGEFPDARPDRVDSYWMRGQIVDDGFSVRSRVRIPVDPYLHDGVGRESAHCHPECDSRASDREGPVGQPLRIVREWNVLGRGGCTYFEGSHRLLPVLSCRECVHPSWVMGEAPER